MLIERISFTVYYLNNVYYVGITLCPRWDRSESPPIRPFRLYTLSPCYTETIYIANKAFCTSSIHTFFSNTVYHPFAEVSEIEYSAPFYWSISVFYGSPFVYYSVRTPFGLPPFFTTSSHNSCIFLPCLFFLFSGPLSSLFPHQVLFRYRLFSPALLPILFSSLTPYFSFRFHSTFHLPFQLGPMLPYLILSHPIPSFTFFSY